MRWLYPAAILAILAAGLFVARRSSAGTLGPVFVPAEFWNDQGASPDGLDEQYEEMTPDRYATADANVAAFLATLKHAEGNAGYNTLFGYGTFEGYDRHPNVRVPFRDTFSTAAGPYQINWPTYRDFAHRLGLSDFSPETQDRIAVEIIRSEGALDDVQAGRFSEAVAKLGRRWASLPSSPADQPTRSLDSLIAVFLKAGGTLAG